MQERIIDLEPVAVRPSTAGRLLEIGATKTYELIKQGKLKCITVGADRRVTMESIRALARGE